MLTSAVWWDSTSVGLVWWTELVDKSNINNKGDNLAGASCLLLFPLLSLYSVRNHDKEDK